MHVSFYSAKHKHSMYQMWLSRQCFCFLFFFFFVRTEAVIHCRHLYLCLLHLLTQKDYQKKTYYDNSHGKRMKASVMFGMSAPSPL